jgi:Domain of unknown function (DUF4340)
MKFQRTPLILLLIALGLGGFVYFTEFKQTAPPVAQSDAAKLIFGFKEQTVQRLKIQSARGSLAFEKGKAPVTLKPKPTPSPSPKPEFDEAAEPAPPSPPTAKSSPSPASPSPSPLTAWWQMTTPEQVPASDGQVAFLLNLLATGKSDRSFTVPGSRLAEFGLDQPVATIEIQLDNGQTHKLVMGLPNFDRRSVYAQVDPPATAQPDAMVVLVPFDFYSAIDRPIADWKLTAELPPPTNPASPDSSKAPTVISPAASPTATPLATPPATPPATPTASPPVTPKPNRPESGSASPSASPKPAGSPTPAPQ